MVTDVQESTSVPTKTQSNMSQAPPQPRSPSNNQENSSKTQTLTQQQKATGAKKKKKKKNTSIPGSTQIVGVTKPTAQSLPCHSNSANMSEHASSSSASSAPVDPTTTQQWQQRVQSLRTALSKAQKENQLLTSDLAAALARASDAEDAEDAVNKGLLTARSVISQRDRAIAELKSASSNLRADLTHLQEEKKKTDKRLILLKTVSANLQEARESRDTVEKKLEDANREISLLNEQNTSLGKDIESLKQHLEKMEMVKQQLARREIEIDELSRSKLRVEEKSRQGEVRAFAVGAISILSASIIMRVLGRGRGKDRE